MAASPDDIGRIAGLIADIRIAFLTTVAPDGSLHARPMATQRERFDGSLWFFTRLDSAKVHEADNEQHVSVTYADPSASTYVALTGTAKTFQDRDKAADLWHPMLKTWFPQGLDDPQLAIMEVQVEHAEYWDSPTSTFVRLLGISAATRGNKLPPQPDHGTVDFGAASRAH